MYKLHFASWLHTMHLFATFMRNNWKSWSVATFENQHMSVQVIFFPGIVLNFLKRVFHCVFLCILRCSCRKRQNVVHEVLFFMCCFSLCRNIKWPPLIFSYSLRVPISSQILFGYIIGYRIRLKNIVFLFFKLCSALKPKHNPWLYGIPNSHDSFNVLT